VISRIFQGNTRGLGPWKQSKLRIFSWILAVLTLMSVSAAAQSTEAGINDRLHGKQLFLKGFWSDDRLKFDTDGRPLGDYKQVSFTLGGFDMHKTKLSGDKLILDGERTGLAFNEKGEIRKVKLGTPIRIEIDGHGNTDFTKALDAIFAVSLADLTPFLPTYWQIYAHKRFVLNEPVPAIKDLRKNPNPLDTENKPSENNAKHIGGTVKAPRLLHSVEPGFTKAARAEKFSGNVQVYLWVGEDGVPSHLRIVQPAGLGLDEQALAAVQQYRFAPATRDGEPVKVDLYIYVNFQIF